ncbi:hypothetical protein DNTS_025313 [Danionella cerebrum]|uniref:Uncharacterized protein n=1 Tax=Danionella cerebrum TaxID=2873325 RepID=A0A553MKC9_9TELE|nr:hypothetical protein DNTS_025313 [Danionella translucida]
MRYLDIHCLSEMTQQVTSVSGLVLLGVCLEDLSPLLSFFDLLDVGTDFLADFLKTGLAVRRLHGVHLVNSNNELVHSQRVGKEGMLTGLSVLGDTSLKLTNASSDNQNVTVSLEEG